MSASTAKSIKKDYLSGESSLHRFYHYPIHPLPDFRQVISDKSFPQRNREVLVSALKRQYSGITTTEATLANIERLVDSNVYTLTTGHQLNLFGGSMYTPYKVMTVIRLAEQLNDEISEAHFVPVYWIHTEDHDYEEINHFYPDFAEKSTYSAPFTGATGDHVLTEEINGMIPAHFPPELKASYQPGMTLAEATLRFNNELYGKYGLVILDASDPELKGLFKGVLQKEIGEKTSYNAITKTSAQLGEAGYPQQITSREVNLFYLDGEGRDRIEEQDGTFRVVGRSKSWTWEEIMENIQTSPEFFSPNVSLRPLYQEVILPNLLYTGGWGELSYWMQLKGMFDQHEINFPVLLPRMSGVFFPKETLKDWKALGFSPDEIDLPTYQLYQKYMPTVWDDSVFQSLSGDILATFDKLSGYLEEISATLPRSSEGQKVKTKRFLDNLYTKIHRVKRNDNRQPFAKVSGLKNAISPDGLVQERVLGLGSFPAYNPHELVRLIHTQCDPLVFDKVYYFPQRVESTP
ncbi:bacillithiol biosynthesis cysteine-adding enzyme BshC [bacterium]|nr:bacillithiol biosynthesis cysteine-adding enzyme BshC [bacterium]